MVDHESQVTDIKVSPVILLTLIQKTEILLHYIYIIAGPIYHDVIIYGLIIY